MMENWYNETFRPWVGMIPQNREDRDYLYPREEEWELHAEGRCPRDDTYEEREVAWEASPDYDELMERGDNEVVEEEPPLDTLYAWLEEGCRPVPNRG